MTDYYLDASVGIDGAGTAVSPFRVLNGKTFANYDRVWIRRTGPTVSVVNAAYTTPNVIGLELLGWPFPGEYGYNERDLSLGAWDADVETHWHAFLTTAATGTIIQGTTANFLFIRRGVITRTTVTGATRIIWMTQTITFDKCEFRSTLALNETFNLGSNMLFPRTFLDCHILSGGAGVGDNVFVSGTEIRHMHLINVSILYNRSAVEWHCKALTGSGSPFLRLSTIIITIELHASSTLPNPDPEILDISPSSHQSIGTLKLTSVDDRIITPVVDDSTSVIMTYNELLINMPTVNVKRGTTISNTSTLICRRLQIRCNTLGQTRWNSSNVVVYPLVDHVNVIGHTYTPDASTSEVFIKSALDDVSLTSSFQAQLASGRWMTRTMSSSGMLCNVRRNGLTSSTVYVQQKSTVVPNMNLDIPDIIFIGSFNAPFSTFFSQSLASGEHTLTVYMADYTVEPDSNVYQFRTLEVQYCIDSVKYYTATSIVYADDSVWTNDTDLVSYKMHITFTLPSEAIVSAAVLINDVNIPDSYMYVDAVPVLT